MDILVGFGDQFLQVLPMVDARFQALALPDRTPTLWQGSAWQALPYFLTRWKTRIGVCLAQYNALFIQAYLAAVGLQQTADVQICIGPCDSVLAPVVAASKYAYVDCFKVLVEHGADISTADSEGRTPVFYASWYGDFDCLKRLIE